VAVATILVATVAAVPACGTEDIPVATLPGAEAGHATCQAPLDGGAPLPTGDAESTACETGEFCQPTTCGESPGVCEATPVSCDGQPYSPVCGCNDVTYVNDCVRQLAQVGLRSAQACSDTAAFCGGPTKCAPSSAGDSVCAYVIPPLPSFLVQPFLNPQLGLCGAATSGVSEGFGICWVVPKTSPAVDGGPVLHKILPSCEISPTCLNPYVALQTSGIYLEAPDCQPGALLDAGSDAGLDAGPGGGPDGG
jgi:hypothetical protein